MEMLTYIFVAKWIVALNHGVLSTRLGGKIVFYSIRVWGGRYYADVRQRYDMAYYTIL